MNTTSGGLRDLLAALWASMTGRGPAEERPEDIRYWAKLAKSGALRPVIDRRHTFAQMREAHA